MNVSTNELRAIEFRVETVNLHLHGTVKPKPIALCICDFSRALSEWQIIARNCDWFIVLFVTVVIGRSNCFGFGFSTVI